MRLKLFPAYLWWWDQKKQTNKQTWMPLEQEHEIPLMIRKRSQGLQAQPASPLPLSTWGQELWMELFTCFSLSCASTGTAWSHVFHRCTSCTSATIGFKQELSLSWLVFALICISSPWVPQHYLLSSQGSLHPLSLPLTPASFFLRLLMVWTRSLWKPSFSIRVLLLP